MHLNTFQNNYWPKCKTKATRKISQLPPKYKKKKLFSNYFLNVSPQLMAVMGDGGHLRILQKTQICFKSYSLNLWWTRVREAIFRFCKKKHVSSFLFELFFEFMVDKGEGGYLKILHKEHIILHNFRSNYSLNLWWTRVREAI